MRKILDLLLIFSILSSPLFTACGGAKQLNTNSASTFSENKQSVSAAGSQANSSEIAKPSSKAIVWELGKNLSMAALMYDLKGEQNSDSLTRAKILAEEVGAEIAPFPVKTGEKSKDTAAILAYLLKDSSQIVSKIKTKYNAEHPPLFEIAVKSTLLMLLYFPDDSIGKSSLSAIKRAAATAKLPEHLIKPLADKIESNASRDEVISAVGKMQDDVSVYLKTQS